MPGHSEDIASLPSPVSPDSKIFFWQQLVVLTADASSMVKDKTKSLGEIQSLNQKTNSITRLVSLYSPEKIDMESKNQPL